MSTAHPPAHVALDPPYLEEVSPGIFAYIQPDGTWFLNNAGWVTGDDGVILVDTTGTEKRAHAFQQAVRQTAGLPATALVNTHAHADHTHGNFAWAPQTAIIGHTLCRDEVLRGNLEWTKQRFPGGDFGNPIKTPPFVTFDERLDVYAGDLKIELIHVGPAHTTNDVLAWIPERRVLFSGDVVFNGGTPFGVAGSISGWIETVEVVRELNPAVIVPGHGPVCDAAVLDTIEGYLRFVLREAERGLAAGVPPLALARDLDLGEFAGLTDPERIVGNLHRAYHELRGNPPGSAMDAVAALEEMVEYNGGEPLRCLA